MPIVEKNPALYNYFNLSYLKEAIMAAPKKYSSKSKKVQKKKETKTPLFLLGGGVIILLIASFFVFGKKPEPFTPEVVGSPKLQVDEALVDLGDVQLGKTVQTSFEVHNVGDQDLHFTQKPYVEVKEGC